MGTRAMFLGRVGEGATRADFALPTHHLVTHAAVLGMTGSGKTGLCVTLVEEALRSKVPVLLLDVKGDLANLLLTFPTLSAGEFLPWVDVDAARREGVAPEAAAEALASRWREGLAGWGLGAGDVAALRGGVATRVITPGTSACEPLHVLSALESRSALWDHDEESARDALSASLSLLLRMIRHDADPTTSREHVLLMHLAERRLRAGEATALESLVADLQSPPLQRVGALALDEFLPPSERADLARDLNTLIASPTFATWRQGAALDVGAWLAPRDDGRTPAVLLSVAHLDDDERMLVLSLVLEQVLGWVRGLSGTSDLRALVLFDEVYGFLPPHPSSPPTKRPMLALLKQARAFGVGLVLATQNPMDVDYKALSNAGVWFVGRLQTDADRARVVEGLTAARTQGEATDTRALDDVIKSLPPRTFHVRDVHAPGPAAQLSVRWTLSWLRGPLTRAELRRVAGVARPAPVVAPVAAPAAVTASVPVEAAARAMPERPVARGVPAAPSGWRTWHHAPLAEVTGAWRYAPWVGATLVAHVRDAKLGVQWNRSVRAMAPLDDGRVDTARGRWFDAARVLEAPPPGEYADLAGLLRKGASTAVERSLREEIYRTTTLAVYVHKDLGLVSQPEEPAAAFAQRCVAEAQRRALAQRDAVVADAAPKLQRLADRVTAAQSALQAAAQASPVGGAMAAVAAMARGPSGAFRRIEAQQDKLATRREKAQAELTRAEGDLREAVARRDAEIAELGRAASQAATEIETRSLGPKKDDVELTEVGVVWVPTPA